MNLMEALERLKRSAAENARPLNVFLACGFTPLHLQTFLSAHLRDLAPACRVEVKTGLFGDLIGNLQRLGPAEHDALAVVVEWADLDSRLGLRNLGGWQVERLPEIVTAVSQSLERLTLVLQEVSLPTVLCLPTLPLPPISYCGMRQSGGFELTLRRRLASFAESISNTSHISLVGQQRLDEISPFGTRFDLRTEIAQGFPYKISHAAAVGQLLAELICKPQPKKGIITDLDDTLWAGILGEVGVEGIHWHLEEHAQLHGIYQQFLASLASAGILVAAASKNDSALVDLALEREDLLLSRTKIFPIEAHWRQKSESVQNILKKWNVLPDSVVFVDDSPMEVAEVQSAFPEMECLLFPKADHAAFWEFLAALRDRFAKTAITEEDSLRTQSLRNSTAVGDSGGRGISQEEFLQQLRGRLAFDLRKPLQETRAFELVNKTNQFNLNGRRYDEPAWKKVLQDPRSSLITVSYEDKFGRLGRIAVLIGRMEGGQFVMESWVMSCRAFSRRIEFHCLAYVFDQLGASAIVFELQATSRNGPLMEFMKQILDTSMEGSPHLSRSFFFARAPKMPHQVEMLGAAE
jgi:FkbH-like protein